MADVKVVLYARDEDRQLAEEQAETLGVPLGKVDLPPALTKVPAFCQDECTPYDVLLENLEKVWNGEGTCVFVHGRANFLANGEGDNYFILSEGRLSRRKAARSSGSSDFVLTAGPLPYEEIDSMATESRENYDAMLEATARLDKARYDFYCD